MNTMAPPRPAPLAGLTGLLARRARLTPGPAAAAQARRQVRTAISDWDVAVDADVAVLLTSDLVTHALRHAADEALVLGIRYSAGRLRVDVHGGSSCPPNADGTSAGPAAAPGLALIGRLAAERGCYRTPAGNAVYFTLACQPEPG